MADQDHSLRTSWLLTLLFFPAAAVLAVLGLFSFASRPAVLLAVLLLYLAHRLLFATTMIGLSLRQLRAREKRPVDAPAPSVSVAVTAHNEAEFIVDCLCSVLFQNPRPTEVFVVNDGSTDETLCRLIASFDLTPSAIYPEVLSGEGIQLYRNPALPELVVIDQPRGGKAAALNRVLRIATGTLFVTIDGDTLVAPDALGNLVAAFQRDARVIAAGGTVKPGNGIALESLSGARAKLPSGVWARLQWIEYALSFFGRFGWMRINTLVSMSGCFTAFRSEALRACGGFDGTSLADDYEIAYRLHAHHLARGLDYRIVSVADALALTIVPDTPVTLYRQRRRWSEGCFQTLLRYRRLAGRTRFRGIGIFLLPFKFFVAAENCWGIASLPLALALVLYGPLPVALMMVLQLVALKLAIDIGVCWILLTLHQRHLPPKLAWKPLLSQFALVPVYVLMQQLVPFAHIAGVVRALRRGSHADGTDSYAAAIRNAQLTGESQAFSE